MKPRYLSILVTATVMASVPFLLLRAGEKAGGDERPEVVPESQPGPESFEFDIDRGETIPAGAEAPPDEPRRSFWSRLFGGSDGEADEAADELPADEEEASPEEMLAVQEEVRRQAMEVQAMRSFREADRAMDRDEYELALRHLREGLEEMPVRPQTLAIREDARRKQGECAYRMALNYYRDGRFADARQAIRSAQEYYPADRRPARLAERITRDAERIAEIEARPVPIRKSTEHLERQEKFRSAMRRGIEHMEIGNYEKARREFNSVLSEDPLNEEAIFHLKKIGEREYAGETMRLDAFSRDMMAQVRRAWTPPVLHEVVAPDVAVHDPTVISPRRRRLLDKLNTIRIPELDFRQANIVDVIHYLDQQAMAGDPDKEGVNFILNLKRPDAPDVWDEPVRRPEIDPLAVEEPPDALVAAARAAGVPLITLRLRNILLIDAIRYITEVTGLRYRVEDDAVVITPEDVVVGVVITRTYRVQPTIQEIMMREDPDDREIGFLDFDAPRRTIREDVRAFFVEAGVPFPEGTSIVYKPSINLLIVSNTEENLERFERILSTLDVIPTQVEIEARFVEIAQTDLMELGFEWTLTDDWLIAHEAGPGAPVPLSARERIQIDRGRITRGLRHLTDPVTGRDLGGILSISSVLTNPELNFVMHLLQQRSGVNLLSAPKVTTRSGSNAEIKIVEELIYPTDYQIQEGAPISTEAGTEVREYHVPTAFAIRDLGVILNVTPVVGPDGYTIDLTMLPEVVELAGWVDYGTTIEDIDGAMRQIPIIQPIFHARSIATSITIWDGHTVVMGGLITEGQTTKEDKVPILGDIPLVGSLFRSRTSESVKRNLLIFVTARLVDPAGVKIPTVTSAGLIE